MPVNTILSMFAQGRGDMGHLGDWDPRVVKMMDMKQEEIGDIKALTPDSFIINRIFVD